MGLKKNNNKTKTTKTQTKPLKTSVNFLVTETNETSTFCICLVTRLWF